MKSCISVRFSIFFKFNKNKRKLYLIKLIFFIQSTFLKNSNDKTAEFAELDCFFSENFKEFYKILIFLAF